MEESQLLLELDGPLAIVTLNRPRFLNALTWEMYDGLARACEAVERDSNVRVMIVRGAGTKAFAAGTDISQFEKFAGADDGLAYERKMEGTIGRLEAMTKPTIAAVEGYAVGAGAAIAIVCDLRYGGDTSAIGVPIARTLGNCLSMANHARLLDLLGPSRVKELIYRATLVDAVQAKSVGLLNDVAPHGEAFAHARRIGLEIATHAPITMSVTKEAIRRLQVQRRAADGDDLVARAYASEDFREGVAAFIARRKPAFADR